MTQPLAALASKVVGAAATAVANNPTVVEAVVRTNIERARTEFRRGRHAAGNRLLEDAINRLDRLATRRTVPARLQAIRAVAVSVKGQGLARSGRPEQAAAVFADAIVLFVGLDDEALSPRDRGDYGVALASIGSDAEARRQIEAARIRNAATPEAVNHLARIHVDNGDIDAAEALLQEALLVVPGDADGLASLGLIQQVRGDPDAAATFTSAAIAYVEHGRARDALTTLASLPEAASDDPALHGIRAEALRLDGQFEEAVDAYGRALAAEPDDPTLLAGRGASMVALGRLEQARADFDHALRFQPDSVTLLLCAADAALALDDVEGAFAAARRAVDVDSGSALAFGLLAEAERRQDALPSAVEHIRLARALDTSDDTELLRLQATLEAAVGATETACDLLRQLCARTESTLEDHATLSTILLELGRRGEAVEVAEAAAGRWPDSVEAVMLHGGVLLQAGRPAQAVGQLRRAAELDPGSGTTRLQLAVALMRTGADDEALSEAQAVLDRQPEQAEPHVVVADILAAMQRWDESAAMAREALVREPGSVDGLAALARAQLATGDAGAASLLRRALARAPDRPDLRLLLAQAIAGNRPAKALDLLADMPDDLATDDDIRPQWLLLRARLRSGEGRLPHAEADLDRLVEIRPGWPEGWFERADLGRRRGRFEEAMADADRAVGLDPTNATARAIRATILTELGRLDDARADLEAAIAAEPGHVLALAQLSRASEDPDAARGFLDRALAAEPDNRAVLIEKGWLEVRLGAYAEALALFDQLVAEGADTEALTGRADALRLLGRTPEAVSEAARAVEVEPDNQEAIRSLGFALRATGDTARAIDVFMGAYEANPDDIRISTDLSWALATGDRLGEALALIDRTVLAAPSDAWALTQFATMLNDAGAYAMARGVARHGLVLYPDDVDLWNSLGWALQYADQPDAAGAEHAYQQSWDRQPAEDRDPWVLASIADTHHVRGQAAQARTQYRRALEIAERARTVNPAVVSTIGWCQFRLGDLTAAARAFLEVSAGQPAAEVFDFALAILCSGHHQRAHNSYTDALERITERHPLRRRGYILVALSDLRQAVRDWPDVRDVPVTVQIEADLTAALADLPSVSGLAAPAALHLDR